MYNSFSYFVDRQVTTLYRRRFPGYLVKFPCRVSGFIRGRDDSVPGFLRLEEGSEMVGGAVACGVYGLAAGIGGIDT